MRCIGWIGWSECKSGWFFCGVRILGKMRGRHISAGECVVDLEEMRLEELRGRH
jgi:hypothetical protein